jgi:hypothetical protein
MTLWQKPLGPVKIDWARAPRGMTHCLLNREQGFIEEVSGIPTQLYNAQNVMTAVSRAGLGFYTANNPGSTYYSCAQGPAQCSMEVLIYYSGGSTTGRWCGMQEGNPTSTTYDRAMGCDDTGKASFYMFDGSLRYAFASNLSLVAGTVYHLVGTTDGTVMRIYVNGIEAGPSQVAGVGYQGYSTPVFVQGTGYPWGTLNGNTGDTIIHCIFANQAWSAGEVLQRYLDPYAFLISDLGEKMALPSVALTTVSTTGSTLPMMGVG